MIYFLFCTVLPPAASKADQTHICDDFLNLTQFFQILLFSVLIEMNDVNNVIYNFELYNQLLRIHRFLTRSL